jgi:ATP-dependent DNA helicase RecG
MNLQELEQWVSRGEAAQVEFKATTGQRSDAAKTVCAMLNGRGGFVFFGVTPARRIRGQQIGEGTLEDVAAELRRIDPPAFPEIETVELESGSFVIVIRVPGGSPPYTYDGRPFKRQGPTTVIMPRSEYERLLAERMHSQNRWETHPATGITLDDLDKNEIVRTINEAIRRGRMDDPGTRDPRELLQGLKLMENGQILNAAVVLFGKSDRLLPRYPQCLLRMAQFKGLSNTDDFLDNQQEHGNLFQLWQRGQRFCREHLPIAGRIVPNLFERVDDPLYPMEALREALANALCHRDYSISGGAVSLAIFDDRLEITSAGNLHFGLTVEDLTRPHTSQPWNPVIAQTCYRRGIIETWGRGTIKMAKLMDEAGLTPPEFEEITNSLLVRFRPTRYVPPTRVGHDLNPLQREVLDILAQTGPTALHHIREAMEAPVPRRTLQDNLQLLRKLDLVDTTGRGSGARWMLKGVPVP